jgi:hypothetical protein
MKGLSKEIDKMMFNSPKLYGLIRQHMSVESRVKVVKNCTTQSGMQKRILRNYGRL